MREKWSERNTSEAEIITVHNQRKRDDKSNEQQHRAARYLLGANKKD